MSNDHDRHPSAREPHPEAGLPRSPGRQPRQPGGGPPWSGSESEGPHWGGPQSDGPPWGGPQSDGPPWGGPQSGGPPWGGPQSGGPQWSGPLPDGQQRGDGPPSGRPRPDSVYPGGERSTGAYPGGQWPEGTQPGSRRPESARLVDEPPARPVESAPKRKRSRSPWVFGVLLLVVVLGLAGALVVALGGAGPVMNALGVGQKAKKAVDGKMNTPIADGTFEFTVTGARCGVDKVGEGKSVQPAQGQFCLIDVTVTNVGSSAVIFDDISQTGYDATGNQYSADSSADVVANKAQPAFLKPIDPGATVQGRLAFDISPRETLTAIVLHESIFSAGVRVPLN